MNEPRIAQGEEKVAIHEHKWKTLAHLDGCHYYAWNYACECGATASQHYERDVEFDPYSAVWMDPEGREPCTRCEQLLGGERPTFTLRVVLKDGTVEKDETGELPREEAA